MRHHIAVLLSVFVLTGSILFSCSENSVTNPNSPPKEIRELPEPLTLMDQEITGLSNDFGISLFKEINNSEELDNVFISPFSVSMALAMTYNGASGTTEEVMRSVLQYGDLSYAEINESYRHITNLLLTLDDKIEFQIGNSIWIDDFFSVENTFIDINRTYFDAEVATLELQGPEAPSTINEWVNTKTNGKIPKLLDSIDGNMVMFLINAIFFKGDWTSQFKVQDTVDDNFYLLDGSVKSIPMMFQQHRFGYYSGTDVQVVNLPYGGQAFSMTIVLPDEDVDINSLISQIESEKLQEWIDGLHEEDVILTMPKFKFEYKKSLNEVLKALGMEVAFLAGEANFAKINPLQDLYIDEVKHSTFIDVNEEGTEAAAATSVGIGITSAPQQIELKIDRPFIFMIREKYSNTTLFMGKIVEPVIQ